MKKAIALFILVACMALTMAQSASAGSILYAKPLAEATAAMNDTALVDVSSVYVSSWLASYYVFKPKTVTATEGLIIYPGAMIDSRAYAVIAQAIAQQGILVAIIPMPLNLAILGYDRANKPIEKFTGIQTWTISGHSLGGAMACKYAVNHLDKVDGMVLFAAYPDSADRLDGTSLPVLSLYATNDGLTSLDDIESSRAMLPADADFYEIVGGNHSYFGYYTPSSSGDGTATITRADQTSQIVNETVNFINAL
ncbi:MAG: alpha/beta hydrolase [Deltaproteobacteria bacterium]|nr:alpha/beta hydrolase [Deltaproteobacteria bacterium]